MLKAKLNYVAGKVDRKETKSEFVLLDKQLPLSEHQIPDEILYSDLKEDAYLMRVYQELNGARGSYGQLATHKSGQAKVIDFLIKNGFKLLHNCGVNWADTNIHIEKECNIAFFTERDGLLVVSMPHYLYFVYERVDKKQTEFLRELIAFSKEEEGKNGENRISLIMSECGSLFLEDFDLEPQKVDFDNYADSFKEDYDFLIDFISSPDAGLVLLSGKPGTGKSSLLTAICAETDKRVVYMPPDAISVLSNPEFQSFAKRSLTDSILFVEDSEQILLAGPGGNRSSQTATLLNLTDGILGKILKLKIICTLNLNSFDDIDQALLRKGRLKKHIEFSELTVDKGQKLADKLKKSVKITEMMTLGDIYNIETSNGIEKKIRPRVGF